MLHDDAVAVEPVRAAHPLETSDRTGLGNGKDTVIAFGRTVIDAEKIIGRLQIGEVTAKGCCRAESGAECEDARRGAAVALLFNRIVFGVFRDEASRSPSKAVATEVDVEGLSPFLPRSRHFFKAVQYPLGLLHIRRDDQHDLFMRRAGNRQE